MTMIKRVKRMFEGPGFRGDSMFQTYYGSILKERQDGGPNAEEARRDFEHLRQAVSRISVY